MTTPGSPGHIFVGLSVKADLYWVSWKALEYGSGLSNKRRKTTLRWELYSWIIWGAASILCIQFVVSSGINVHSSVSKAKWQIEQRPTRLPLSWMLWSCMWPSLWLVSNYGFVSRHVGGVERWPYTKTHRYCLRVDMTDYQGSQPLVCFAITQPASVVLCSFDVLFGSKWHIDRRLWWMVTAFWNLISFSLYRHFVVEGGLAA